MGTDIHGGLVRKTWSNKEELVEFPPTFMDRDYEFFAILGGVRNGYGFAGCELFTPITPIAESRGFPDDFEKNHLDWIDDFQFGEHSISHITFQELMDTELHLQETEHTGWFSEKDYLAHKAGEYTSYCGGITGSKVTKVTEKDYKSKNYTLPEGHSLYIQPKWTDSPFKEKIEKLKSWMKLYEEHQSQNNPVLVFGFDS